MKLPSAKLLLCLTVCCLFHATSIGQNQAEDNFRAMHWGLDDGISQGEVYHMIKDVNGFLWIGTRYGLNRFDGNTFKIYLPNRNDRRSIIDDHVIDGLVEDSLHNIWIGANNGLSRYNIKTDDFTNFFPDSTIKKNPSYIVPFWATKSEVICIEGESAITSYNIYTSTKKVLADLHGFEGKFVGPSGSYSVFDSSTNSVWCLIGNPKAVLLNINLTTNKKNFYPLPHYSKSDYFDAECFCYDTRRKCFWINGNEGLLQFTLADNQFHHINALRKYELQKDYSRYVGITLDKRGRIWFATRPTGMIIYNPDDDSVSFPFPGDSVLQYDCADANACIYCDRDNIIWSGSWLRKGFYEILPFKPVVKHYKPSHKKDSLSSNVVMSAADAGDGNIWFSTFNGINILDKKTGAFHVLQKQHLRGLISTNDILGVVAIDTLEQKAWLLAETGVFRTNISTKICTPVIFRNQNNEVTRSGGMPRFNGKELLFTPGDNKSQSVFFLNLKSDTAYEKLSFAGAPFNFFFTAFTENNYLFLYGDRSKNDNKTYENKNGNWTRVSTPIDSLRWTSIAYVKEDNSYWVAAESQLFHFNKNFQIIQTYTKDNGLPELPVVGLKNDNNGNIWFHTDRSIQELNVRTGQITTLSERDGYEKQDFELLPFADKDKNGNIYYGGGVFGNGFNMISPDNFITTVSSVYLRSLTINQNPFLLKESINNTDTLTLKYNQTKIALDVGIIDLYSRGKSRMRYKLEGQNLNEQWQYAPYYYTIRYEGLPPGNYTLVIQASNTSNEFNGLEKKLWILISPPFWDTWWFRTIAVFVAIALVYLLIQYRSRSLKKKNILLEEKVIHRTKELKHSLEDLRAAQAQLIQSEKMASLGELTAGIAHEIQNPLNFVNNFSEVSYELVDEMNNELSKGDIPEAKMIADNIKQNLEKITHHGKRADAIVKGMLQHSRINTGQKQPTDINALAGEYLRLAYHGLRAKNKNFNATLETDFDATIGEINVVPQDIGRVLLNLYNNAFYALSSNKSERANNSYQPTVSVSTKKIGDKVLISVKDNGTGIPEGIVAKIFQPFFTTKPTGQGTGLGLSLSYDIIKAHGGEIKVETVEGERTEFNILLPV